MSEGICEQIGKGIILNWSSVYILSVKRDEEGTRESADGLLWIERRQQPVLALTSGLLIKKYPYTQRMRGLVCEPSSVREG